MNAHVNQTTFESAYFLAKWDRLQAYAREAIEARPEIDSAASLGEKIEIARFALAPVRRAAEMFMGYEHCTAVGAAIKARVAAWLDGGAIEGMVA